MKIAIGKTSLKTKVLLTWYGKNIPQCDVLGIPTNGDGKYVLVGWKTNPTPFDAWADDGASIIARQEFYNKFSLSITEYKYFYWLSIDEEVELVAYYPKQTCSDCKLSAPHIEPDKSGNFTCKLCLMLQILEQERTIVLPTK